MTKPSIINLVADLVDRYHTRDPFELCDYLNINLYKHKLGSLKGYYLFYNNNHHIVLNSNLTRREQRIILGHELGHALEHSGLSHFFSETANLLESKDRIELEANLFCAELLISDIDILSFAEYDSSINNLCDCLALPDWLIDCKVQMLISKGYTDFHYMYIATKNSIKTLSTLP